MKLRDLATLAKLPPRKFAAEIGKETRKALRKGDCAQAAFLLQLGKTNKIMSKPAWTTLKARVQRCFRARKKP